MLVFVFVVCLFVCLFVFVCMLFVYLFVCLFVCLFLFVSRCRPFAVSWRKCEPHVTISNISAVFYKYQSFLQISKLSLFAIFWCVSFEWKLFRPLPTQPSSMPTEPIAPIFGFSKKTNLRGMSFKWGTEITFRDFINTEFGDFALIWGRDRERGGRSVWRQLNNKKWARRP